MIVNPGTTGSPAGGAGNRGPGMGRPDTRPSSGVAPVRRHVVPLAGIPGLPFARLVDEAHGAGLGAGLAHGGLEAHLRAHGEAREIVVQHGVAVEIELAVVWGAQEAVALVLE